MTDEAGRCPECGHYLQHSACRWYACPCTADHRPPVSGEPPCGILDALSEAYAEADNATEFMDEVAPDLWPQLVYTALVSRGYVLTAGRPPVSGEPRGSHAEMEGSQGHDFWLPPVSGEPRTEDEKILDVIRSIWRFIKERL